MKKVIFILASIFAVQLVIVSCTLFCPCGCGGSKTPQKISILSWNVETVTQPNAVIDQSTPTPYDRAFKALSIGNIGVAYLRNESLGSTFSSAYACSPAPQEVAETFNTIQIISNTDIVLVGDNDVIKSGDDITNRFVIARPFETDFKPISEFIDELVIYEYDRYLLRLMDKPVQETILDFEIIIEMSNGKVFILENERLTVF